MSISNILSAQPGAMFARVVKVETDVSTGLFNFVIVGLANKEIEEARDRVSAALKNSGVASPKSENRKIVTSLSPAHIHKSGTHFDLPIALGYLSATKQINLDKWKDSIFLGELSLSGELMPVSGALSVAMLCQSESIKNIFVPMKNALECALVPGINIYPVKTLEELIAFLKDEVNIETQEYLDTTDLALSPSQNSTENSFSEVRGQELDKRALLIAAAGGHNIALYGPPGTGKTMLAKAFREILPPLSRKSMLEVTAIHSFTNTSSGLVTKPPFRSPHHSSSSVSIIGGGNNLRPGEITLAHRGVLFLDEFPEFDKSVLESLRQPLEDGEVVVARAKGSVKYPARFTLVAALNPCPCGFRGSQIRQCICKESDILRYERKVSGPIMDRIDLWVEVPHVAYEEFLNKESTPNNFEQQVLRVRSVQNSRYGNDKLNAHIGNKEINILDLLPEAEGVLIDYAKKFSLSPRSFNRLKKVARTIADLSGSQQIEIPHILEAFQYRPKVG